jgi:hypothetical protein
MAVMVALACNYHLVEQQHIMQVVVAEVLDTVQEL